jgi:hypothetical protein
VSDAVAHLPGTDDAHAANGLSHFAYPIDPAAIFAAA